MANALSRLPNQIKLIRVLDQTIDAHVFTLHLEWLQNVYDYLLTLQENVQYVINAFTTTGNYLVFAIKLLPFTTNVTSC
jgi:hypothetical protein